jgi:hypothetical protein
MSRAPDGTVEGARAGRPRDRQIDVAVLTATLAVLDKSGYGGLTLEQVARDAGTTKPAIYRRWPTRQQLVDASGSLSVYVKEAGGARGTDGRAPDQPLRDRAER